MSGMQLLPASRKASEPLAASLRSENKKPHCTQRLACKRVWLQKRQLLLVLSIAFKPQLLRALRIRKTTQTTGQGQLLLEVEKIGATPVLGGVYPNGNYEHPKQLLLLQDRTKERAAVSRTQNVEVWSSVG